MVTQEKSKNQIQIINLPYSDIINEKSRQFNLDPYLIAAMIAVESSFNEKSIRYEKKFKWVYKCEEYAKSWHYTVDTETNLQKFSYGLMQIMGATARYMGYEGFMTDLCIPDVGIHWGCLYFESLLKKHGDIHKAVSAYNAGSPRKKMNGEFVNQKYVNNVFYYFEEFKNANSV